MSHSQNSVILLSSTKIPRPYQHFIIKNSLICSSSFNARIWLDLRNPYKFDWINKIERVQNKFLRFIYMKFPNNYIITDH